MHDRYYESNEYRITFLLLSSLILFKLLISFINTVFFHYQIISSIPKNEETLCILIIITHIASYFYTGKSHIHLAEALNKLSLIGIVSILAIFVSETLISTPFPLVDTSIFHFDKKIGIGISNAVYQTYYNNSLYQLLEVFYYTMRPVVTLTGAILIYLDKSKQFHQYIAFIIISLIIGSIIYYFFPTTGLAAMHNAPVTLEDKMVVSQFHLIHQKTLIHFVIIGHISMPSFHTIAAMTITLSLWEFKKFRYWALGYSVCLIASALLIGGHFSLDILVGIAMSFIIRPIVIKLYSSTK